MPQIIVFLFNCPPNHRGGLHPSLRASDSPNEAMRCAPEPLQYLRASTLQKTCSASLSLLCFSAAHKRAVVPKPFEMDKSQATSWIMEFINFYCSKQFFALAMNKNKNLICFENIKYSLHPNEGMIKKHSHFWFCETFSAQSNLPDNFHKGAHSNCQTSSNLGFKRSKKSAWLGIIISTI